MSAQDSMTLYPISCWTCFLVFSHNLTISQVNIFVHKSFATIPAEQGPKMKLLVQKVCAFKYLNYSPEVCFILPFAVEPTQAVFRRKTMKKFQLTYFKEAF